MLTQCAICSSLMSSHAYESHRYVHDSTDRSFLCEMGCMDMFFETADELERHQRFMHVFSTDNLSPACKNANDDTTSVKSTDSGACPVCQREIGYQNMTRHMLCHDSTNRPFPCTRGCPQTFFACKSSLSRHETDMNHTVKLSTTCKVCRRVCEGSMKHHMRTHDSTRPFRCTDGCVQLYFTTEYCLARHRREVHGNASHASKTCHVCGVNYRGPESQHMQLHDSTDRPFECVDGCIKTFYRTQRHLNHHRRVVHEIVTSQSIKKKCKTATAARSISDTFDSDIMSDHERETTLTTDKNFSKQSEVSSSSVALHSPTQQSFQCQQGSCNKLLDTARNLRRHERTAHEVYLPTTCPICGMTMEKNMSRHMRTHDSTGRPFQCDDGCKGVHFRTSNCLSRHRHSVHRESTVGVTAATATPQLSESLRSRSQPPSSFDTSRTAIPSEPIRPKSSKSSVKSKKSKPLRSIINTPTVQSTFKQEPISPPAKRARIEKLIGTADVLDKNPEDESPLTLASSVDSTLIQPPSSASLENNTTAPLFLPVAEDPIDDSNVPSFSPRHRSPSSSSAASERESDAQWSADDSDDNDWMAPKTKYSKCNICGVARKYLHKHKVVHIPTAFPCTQGCVQTFAKDANDLKTHNTTFHSKHSRRSVGKPRAQVTQKRASVLQKKARSPEVTIIATRTRIAGKCKVCGIQFLDLAEHMKKSNEAVHKTRNLIYQKTYTPTAISTPLPNVTRKRKICTVSPIVRIDDLIPVITPKVVKPTVLVEKNRQPLQQESAPVEKSQPHRIIEQPSTKVKKVVGENDKLNRHSLMMQLIQLPATASNDERTRLLDLMESCD